MSKFDEKLKERLTDRKTAEDLRKNILGLIERGLTPSVMDIRYVKLAEYENSEEDMRKVFSEKAYKVKVRRFKGS